MNIVCLGAQMITTDQQTTEQASLTSITTMMLVCMYRIYLQRDAEYKRHIILKGDR